MEKEEIAHFEQFPLLSQCFKKSSAAEASESVCMWERVKTFSHNMETYQSNNGY